MQAHQIKQHPALFDESRQLELLVNSVTDYAIYMLDVDGRVQTWNTGGERIKGYRAAEIIGENFSRFYIPEDIEAGLPQKNLGIAAAEGRFAGEGWRLRQDGTRFWASVVIDRICQDGQLIGFAKVTRDITERYEAAKRLNEAQDALVNAGKLEAVAKLTLGLAHDFNNLLAVIVNSLDVIGDRVERNLVQRQIDAAMRAAERGVLLTRQLLTFGSARNLAAEALEVNQLLASSWDVLNRAAGRGSLRLELHPKPLWVNADRSQLEAALLNLVANSGDSIEGDGSVVVSTSVRWTRDPARLESKEGWFVTLQVMDTGRGIPREDLGRVFDPFFTTKEVGQGSGLGLSQVFGFATQSGGFTEISSNPGQGTSVSVSLPALEVRDGD